MNNVMKWAITAVTAFLVWAMLFPKLGIATSGIMSLALLGTIIFAVSYVKPEFFGLPFIGKALAKWAAIGCVVLFLFTGGIGMVTSYVTPASVGGIPGTAYVPPQTTPTITTCQVSDELAGKSATITLNAYDQESDTPYSTAVDVDTYVWRKDSLGNWVFVGKTTDTSAYSLTGVSVGDYLKFMGADSTSSSAAYYLDEKEVCIDKQSMNIELPAHKWQVESNMQIVLYDDSGSTELSSGTSNQDDYYMTMGANEETTIYAKIKNNAANAAYRLCGVATTTFNDIDKVKPIGFTAVSTPTKFNNIAVKVNETTGSTTTISSDYIPYKLSAPIMLHEWESQKYQFTVKSSATDPTAASGTANLDGFAIQFFDCAAGRGSDGTMYDDFYTHDDSQGDVGLDEGETSPLGKQLGALVEVR